MSDVTIGHLLAYGGGTFLVLAGSETWPIVLKRARNVQTSLIALLAVIVGCVAIGLILLDHVHCSAGGGHDHSH